MSADSKPTWICRFQAADSKPICWKNLQILSFYFYMLKVLLYVFTHTHIYMYKHSEEVQDTQRHLHAKFLKVLLYIFTHTHMYIYKHSKEVQDSRDSFSILASNLQIQRQYAADSKPIWMSRAFMNEWEWMHENEWIRMIWYEWYDMNEWMRMIWYDMNHVNGNEWIWMLWYGVATMSRLLKMIGLFCRISSLL